MSLVTPEKMKIRTKRTRPNVKSIGIDDLPFRLSAKATQNYDRITRAFWGECRPNTAFQRGREVSVPRPKSRLLFTKMWMAASSLSMAIIGPEVNHDRNA
jgi:hypothetical protein